MKTVSFEQMYHTDFFVREAFAKEQNWFSRGNVYSALSRPKPSHTFLWFKNCRGTITDAARRVLTVEKNELVYMAKGTEYVVDFFDTAPDRVDTIVVHFQLTDALGEDIAPTNVPEKCLVSVDPATALQLEELAAEFRKNVVCLPETNAVIYRIFALVCKKRHKDTTRYRYACIRPGIELLESDSDQSMAEIARACGVSECYFRRLFREYSGESPMAFRQKHRIERAKQLLLSDTYSVGEIAHELHFADIYHFSKAFKAQTGLSPLQFLHEKM